MTGTEPIPFRRAVPISDATICRNLFGTGRQKRLGSAPRPNLFLDVRPSDAG